MPDDFTHQEKASGFIPSYESAIQNYDWVKE